MKLGERVVWLRGKERIVNVDSENVLYDVEDNTEQEEFTNCHLSIINCHCWGTRTQAVVDAQMTNDHWQTTNDKFCCFSMEMIHERN
jgi:hypothetical protein